MSTPWAPHSFELWLVDCSNSLMHAFETPGIRSKATYHSESDTVRNRTEMWGWARFPGRTRYEMARKTANAKDTWRVA